MKKSKCLIVFQLVRFQTTNKMKCRKLSSLTTALRTTSDRHLVRTLEQTMTTFGGTIRKDITKDHRISFPEEGRSIELFATTKSCSEGQHRQNRGQNAAMEIIRRFDDEDRQKTVIVVF